MRFVPCRWTAAFRTDHFDGSNRQVSVSTTFVFGFRMIEVVQESSANLVAACRQCHVVFEPIRLSMFFDLEFGDILAVDLQRHFCVFVSRLRRQGTNSNPVFAFRRRFHRR